MASNSEYALTLRQVFSTDTSIPASDTDTDTSSSLADYPSIREIGLGTCGSVYEIETKGRAIKLGSIAENLRRDFDQTREVWRKFHKYRTLITQHFAEAEKNITIPRIPRCYRFQDKCDAIISRYEEELSANNSLTHSDIDVSNRGKPGFEVEMIPSIPESARIALVREMFDEDDQEDFLNNPKNAHCLIRLYFGRDEWGEHLDTLRNFPLHRDQIEDIGLNSAVLTTELAVGLAIIHWGASLDGMDVEFVLASSPDRRRFGLIGSEFAVQADTSEQNANYRETQLWILDFDKARYFCPKGDPQAIIRRLVVATSGNDPYFPRPSLCPQLWERFSWAYIEASNVILGDIESERKINRELLSLPEAFISALEAQFDEEDTVEGAASIEFAFDSVVYNEDDEDDEDDEDNYGGDEGLRGSYSE